MTRSTLPIPTAPAAAPPDYRDTFEQAPVGIAHVAPDGRWLRVNRKLCDILGYSCDELVPNPVRDIAYPADIDAASPLMQKALAGDIAGYGVEQRYVRKDGKPLWIHLSTTLVRDEAGQPEYFIAVLEDIQARKTAEQESARRNAELEQQTLAADRELENFTYAVSHDLRAPLRAVSGFSMAIEEDYGDKLPGEALAFLREIVQAGRRMAELIDGILALSRCTRGELHQETVDVSKMAAGLIERLTRREPARQVAFRVEPGLTARGDSRLLEAALRHLLGNAWKFTAHAVAPAISVYAEERDGRRRFCVADNGAGFDMKHVDKLFHPFQRLHRQDEFPGTGIGLASVRRIIHRHGGEIDVAAAPGAGATFCFTLPASEPPRE